MISSNILKKLCFIILILVSLINCKKEIRLTSYNYRVNNTDIKVTHLNSTGNNKSLISLIDLDPKTIWYSNLDQGNADSMACSNTFLFEFSKPVYFYGVMVLQSNDPSLNKLKKISIQSYYTNSQSLMSLYGYKEEFTANKTDLRHFYTFKSGTIGQLLPAKVIQINFLECTNMSNKVIGIEDIDIVFIKGSEYKPSYEFDTINKLITSDNRFVNRGNGKWFITRISPGVNNPIYNKIIPDLIYYALNGNTVAESIFFNYLPEGTMADEEIGDLHNWYDIAKNK